MLAPHAAVRPTLVRVIALLLLVAAVAASYHPVSAARPGPLSSSNRLAPARSATLVVNVVEGSSFAPAPISSALVVVHNARTDTEQTYGYTDLNGQVAFKLAPGTYLLSVRAQGRAAQMSDWFTLVAYQSHTVTIALDPAN